MSGNCLIKFFFHLIETLDNQSTVHHQKNLQYYIFIYIALRQFLQKHADMIRIKHMILTDHSRDI